MQQYYFDTLPIHPPPQPLESFTSYLTRVAEANGLKTAEEISQLLLLGASIPSNRITYLSDFPLTSFGALPTVSICPDKRLLMTTFFHLVRKFGQRKYNGHQKLFLRNAIGSCLRYCPYCLMSQSDPYYSLLWRFLHLVECPYHGYPLLDRCMHCGERIPLFAIPSKVPFCALCKKDLRQCRLLKGDTINERVDKLSVEELEFLLSPGECEQVEDIPFLLTERLSYKAKLKSMRIVPNLVDALPRRIIISRSEKEKDEIRKRKQDEQKIKSCRAAFLNYLNYTRFLGITFNDLFNRDYFTAIPSDPNEQSKRRFLLFEREWKL